MRVRGGERVVALPPRVLRELYESLLEARRASIPPPRRSPAAPRAGSSQPQQDGMGAAFPGVAAMRSTGSVGIVERCSLASGRRVKASTESRLAARSTILKSPRSNVEGGRAEGHRPPSPLRSTAERFHTAPQHSNRMNGRAVVQGLTREYGATASATPSRSTLQCAPSRRDGCPPLPPTNWKYGPFDMFLYRPIIARRASRGPGVSCAATRPGTSSSGTPAPPRSGSARASFAVRQRRLW